MKEWTYTYGWYTKSIHMDTCSYRYVDHWMSMLQRSWSCTIIVIWPWAACSVPIDHAWSWIILFLIYMYGSAYICIYTHMRTCIDARKKKMYANSKATTPHRMRFMKIKNRKFCRAVYIYYDVQEHVFRWIGNWVSSIMKIVKIYISSIDTRNVPFSLPIWSGWSPPWPRANQQVRLHEHCISRHQH